MVNYLTMLGLRPAMGIQTTRKTHHATPAYSPMFSLSSLLHAAKRLRVCEDERERKKTSEFQLHPTRTTVVFLNF